MAGCLAGGSWGEAEGDPEHPVLPSSVYCAPSGQDPSAETTSVGEGGGHTIPFQGTWNVRACQLWPVPGLPVTWVASPQLPPRASQEGMKSRLAVPLQPPSLAPGVGLASAQCFSALCCVWSTLRCLQGLGISWA